MLCGTLNDGYQLPSEYDDIQEVDAGIIRSSSAADGREVWESRKSLGSNLSQMSALSGLRISLGSERAMELVNEKVEQLLRSSGIVRVESMGRCGR